MAPTKDPPRTIQRDAGLRLPSAEVIILRSKWLMVQNRKRMVKALAKAETALIISATLDVSEVKREKTLPIIRKRGAPGG